MKHTLLIFATLFAFAGCTDENNSLPKEGTLSLLTYNVAGLPEGFSSSSPEKNTPLISPLLNNFDVVNVQEDFFYHNELVKDVKHPHQSKYEAKISLGDGLNTFSKIPFRSFKRVQWNDCNGADCFTPKGFTYCQLLLAPNIYVDLYNVHANAGVALEDLAARRGNISQLNDFILRNSRGNAVIIMGDFNVRYTRIGDNIRTLLNSENKMQDVWVELIRDNSLPNQDDVALTDCGGADTNPQSEVVDKVLYRSSKFITLTPVEYQVKTNEFLDEDGNWLSDHRPIFASFRYTFLR